MSATSLRALAGVPVRFGRLGVPMVAAALLLAACGDPVGTPCMTVGSGFTASHDCATKCLSRWSVLCPNGESVLPNVCAGTPDCAPGTCPAGQLCYHFDDPFEDRSYCVPDTVCGAALAGSAASEWEIEADRRAAASRAAMAERQRRREQAIRDGQPAVTPQAEPLPDDGG